METRALEATKSMGTALRTHYCNCECRKGCPGNTCGSCGGRIPTFREARQIEAVLAAAKPVVTALAWEADES